MKIREILENNVVPFDTSRRAKRRMNQQTTPSQLDQLSDLVYQRVEKINRLTKEIRNIPVFGFKSVHEIYDFLDHELDTHNMIGFGKRTLMSLPVNELQRLRSLANSDELYFKSMELAGLFSSIESTSAHDDIDSDALIITMISSWLAQLRRVLHNS